MQVVIDIPENLYETITADEYGVHQGKIYNIIRNGTPIPKHGRLIDEDTVATFEDEMVQALAKAPTIIEADKAERSDKE